MTYSNASLKIDPKRYADSGQSLTGDVPLQALSLPSEVLGIGQGVVHYRFNFGIDSENYVYIHGWVETELSLECSRCLKPMAKNFSSEFYLSPVRTAEEAEKLPERYEAVFLTEDKLSVDRIVEEELILNLPIAPAHSTGDCQQIIFH